MIVVDLKVSEKVVFGFVNYVIVISFVIGE